MPGLNPFGQLLSGVRQQSDLAQAARDVHILGLCGSLRRTSANRGLLEAAQQVLPGGAILSIADITEVPVFNEDLLEAGAVPASVRELRDAVQTADAILFAVAERNSSISSALKNAIDWCSMPNVFAEKPAAMMGVGHGGGTAAAQHHLRQVCAFLDMHLLNKPEIMIERFEDMDVFDERGRLQDEKYVERIRVLIMRLVDWSASLKLLGLPGRPSVGL